MKRNDGKPKIFHGTIPGAIRRTDDLKRFHLKRFSESSVNGVEYCKAYDLKYSSFKKWKIEYWKGNLGEMDIDIQKRQGRTKYNEVLDW